MVVGRLSMRVKGDWKMRGSCEAGLAFLYPSLTDTKLRLEHGDTALLALSAFAQSLPSTGSCQIIRTATFTDFSMSLLDPTAPTIFRSTVATCDSRSKRWLLLVFRGIEQSKVLDWSSPFLYPAPFHISLAHILAAQPHLECFKPSEAKAPSFFKPHSVLQRPL